MRIPSSLAVGKDVEFDLTHATVELLRERGMVVIEAFKGLGILLLPKDALTGSNAGVIAVVRSDHLDLVQLETPAAIRLLAIDHRCDSSARNECQRNRSRDFEMLH